MRRLFEEPVFILNMGLEGTSDIIEMHMIAEELGFLPYQEAAN